MERSSGESIPWTMRNQKTPECSRILGAKRLRSVRPKHEPVAVSIAILHTAGPHRAQIFRFIDPYVTSSVPCGLGGAVSQTLYEERQFPVSNGLASRQAHCSCLSRRWRSYWGSVMKEMGLRKWKLYSKRLKLWPSG